LLKRKQLAKESRRRTTIALSFLQEAIDEEAIRHSENICDKSVDVGSFSSTTSFRVLNSPAVVKLKTERTEKRKRFESLEMHLEETFANDEKQLEEQMKLMEEDFLKKQLADRVERAEMRQGQKIDLIKNLFGEEITNKDFSLNSLDDAQSELLKQKEAELDVLYFEEESSILKEENQLREERIRKKTEDHAKLMKERADKEEDLKKQEILAQETFEAALHMHSEKMEQMRMKRKEKQQFAREEMDRKKKEEAEEEMKFAIEEKMLRERLSRRARQRDDLYEQRKNEMEDRRKKMEQQMQDENNEVVEYVRTMNEQLEKEKLSKSRQMRDKKDDMARQMRQQQRLQDQTQSYSHLAFAVPSSYACLPFHFCVAHISHHVDAHVLITFLATFFPLLQISFLLLPLLSFCGPFLPAQTVVFLSFSYAFVPFSRNAYAVQLQMFPALIFLVFSSLPLYQLAPSSILHGLLFSF
jgi:hypothetical protein